MEFGWKTKVEKAGQAVKKMINKRREECEGYWETRKESERKKNEIVYEVWNEILR